MTLKEKARLRRIRALLRSLETQANKILEMLKDEN